MALKDLTLQVQGERTIHCSGCERTIQHTLAKLGGVKRVKADHRTQRIELTLDSQAISPDQVKQELDWIGYQVAEV